MKYKVLDENDRIVEEKDIRYWLFQMEAMALSSNDEYYFENDRDFEDIIECMRIAKNGDIKEVFHKLTVDWNIPLEEVSFEWTLFKFEHGGNPYIAKTTEERQKIFEKYKGKIVRLCDREYFVKE